MNMKPNPPQTLRVHFNDYGSPFGKVPHVDLPATLSPFGTRDTIIIENRAGDFVLITTEESDIRAIPSVEDPRNVPDHLRPHMIKGHLYRWPDRGGRLEYVASIS